MQSVKPHQKVALVTGSSAGIGAGVARRLSSSGYAVVVNARDADRVSDMVDELRKVGPAAAAVADISSPEGLETVFDVVDSEFGRLDLLVNNAGVTLHGPSAEQPLRRWEKVLSLNLTAPFYASQLAYPRMVASGGGVIVNISSIYGLSAAPGRAAYISTKHAIIGLTKALATEWAPDNIRVLAIAPGYIDTEFVAQWRRSGGLDTEAILARTPMNRLGTAEEVADVVSFAASDAARFMTGTLLPVDGGWLAFGGPS